MSGSGPITLALTLGDPAGIGPEIVAKLLADPPRGVRLVVVGSRTALERERRVVPALPRLPAWRPRADAMLQLLDEEPAAGSVEPGRISAEAGRLSHGWVLRAAALAQAGHVQGLVTGPIQKEAWGLAGITSPGHTEALRDAAGARHVLMLLVGRRLRAALATIHLPLVQVPQRLSTAALLADLRLLATSIAHDFGPRRPRLAVCGLNPHAGEGGLLGSEDEQIIRPAVEQAVAEGLLAFGPLPADACIPHAAQGRYDAVLAMYHDQALPAVKCLAPRRAVNVTLGLPWVRTSVDHGTAMDIAGRGLATDLSLRAALRLAVQLVRRRRRSLPLEKTPRGTSTSNVPPPT